MMSAVGKVRGAWKVWGIVLAVGMLAGFASGCTGDEPGDEESDVVDSTQEELVVGQETQIDPGVPAGDQTGDAPSPTGDRRNEVDAQDGAAAPGTIRSEPVPHPWVPKVSGADHDNDA